MITDSTVGSPEATPSVNGSASKSTAGKVSGTSVGDGDESLLVVVGDEESLSFDDEQAATTTDAPRARNTRRDIGWLMTESCQTQSYVRDDRVVRPIPYQGRLPDHVLVGTFTAHPVVMERRMSRWSSVVGWPVVGWFVATMMMVACSGPGGEIVGDPVPLNHPRSSSTVVVATTMAPTSSTVAITPLPDSSVAAAFDELMAIRVRCGRRPGACPLDELAVPGSPMHRDLGELMRRRASSGIVASSHGAIRYRIDAVRVDGDSAEITTCLYDDTVLMMDGSVFDESTVSAVAIWTMADTAQGWRWTSWIMTDWRTEEDLCGFDM